MLGILIQLALAVTVDVNNNEAIKAANKQVAQVMINYWKEADSNGGTTAGSFKESANNDPSINGWNWYESGVLWGAIMEYTYYTRDDTFAETAIQSVTLASFGSVGSFLGNNGFISSTVYGKWNDDMGWWVLPGIVVLISAVSGMETYGIDQKMAGGVTFQKLAERTYDEMWDQWDDESICPGGIFWSRNRVSNDDSIKNYKSTISNAQM